MLGQHFRLDQKARGQDAKRAFKETRPHKASLIFLALPSYGTIGNGPISAAPERAGPVDQTGMASSGIGLEMKNLRVCRESQRAPEFAFRRRALSVLMPVPAYILRYNFDRKQKANRERRVGAQSERFQMEAKL